MKTGKSGFVLAAVLMCSFVSTGAFGSVNDNQVTSQKIREADGTSGQETNSGSGVKTGHIQDGAVTTEKIAEGAVTDGKISGTISGSKLGSHSHSGADLPDGTITGPKMATASISTDKLQDNAVTDAKIAGPISGSKISSTGLNADTVDGQHASAFAPASHIHSMESISGLQGSLAGKSDVTHNHDTLYQQKYGKVAVVAQTGGDYTSPVTAMNDVATWCGTPSAANPCLLKIMPGVYNLGGAVLTAVAFVDIDGSGPNNTVLSGSQTWPTYRVGVANSSLTNIAIENSSGGTAAIDTNYGSPVIRNVRVKAAGQYGVWGGSGDPRLTDVTIDMTGAGWKFGIQMFDGTGTFTNIRVLNADEAFYNYRGTMVIQNMETTAEIMNQGNMTIEGSKVGNVRVILFSSDMATNLVNTQVQGTITRDRELPVILRCFNVYDGNFGPVACPIW